MDDASATPPPAGSELPAPRRNVGPRIAAAALAGLLIIGLAVVGVYTYQEYDRARDASGALSRASTTLESAEDDLLIVDNAVQTGIASVTATQALDASALAGDVRARAIEASDIIGEALADLSDEQRELAEALRESADARAEMMEIAPIILEADAAAATAMAAADQALAEIKAAEELSVQASAEFNKHTADAVRASDALTVQAEAKLNSAAALLAEATAAFPGADFAPFKQYIDAKLGLTALAKEIDALWLAGDIAGSNTKLAAYNQRDAEVVAMAQTLPASVRDPIANAYEAATAEALDAYFEARERARIAGERVSELRRGAAAR